MSTSTTEIPTPEVGRYGLVTAAAPRLDIIDDQIAWAEAEEAKGEMSAWAQGNWVTSEAPCGTAYCIAGHVASSVGEPEFVEAWWDPNIRIEQHRRTIGGESFHVQAVAKAVLGLTDRQAILLFSGGNGILTLKAARDDIAAASDLPRRYTDEDGRPL